MRILLLRLFVASWAIPYVSICFPIFLLFMGWDEGIVAYKDVVNIFWNGE